MRQGKPHGGIGWDGGMDDAGNRIACVGATANQAILAVNSRTTPAGVNRRRPSRSLARRCAAAVKRDAYCLVRALSAWRRR